MGASAEVKTYRYLRVAMVLAACMLGASVLLERFAAGHHCWQTSISAYYYTPAQAVFVGALVAIGVAMIVIKGNTDLEDALLNGAGMLAPVVAFVPTPYHAGCYSVPVTDAVERADVANNINALLSVAALGLAFTLVTGWRDGSTRTLLFRIGFPLAVVVFSGFALWFWLGRDSFIHYAHYAAAIGLFGCIVATAVTNAFGLRQHQQNRGKQDATLRNRYAFLAGLMVVAVAAMGAYRIAFGWEHAVLLIEATVLALFGVLWVMQTQELWHHTVRGITDAGHLPPPSPKEPSG